MLRTGDRTEERLALLVRAGEMFHRSLGVDDTLDNVARMAVESFSDLCLFDMIDDHSERLYVTAGAHRDPSMDVLLKNVGSSILYDTELGIHPAVRVAKSGQPFFVPVFDEAAIHQHAASANHAAFMRRMGYRSKIVVPVIAQGHIFGALSFVRTADTVPFDEQDVDAAQELGRRAGLAVANAKQYYREQHVAATLQRAFLTQDFPQRDGLEFHALYRPGKGDAELGGDWYDAFTVADGSIVITIGDVTGKGIEAARLMVQLRQSVRVGATLDPDPGVILRIANETLLLDRSGAIATAFVGTIAPDSRTLRYASAGHPPALLRRSDAALVPLSGLCPPLGIQTGLTFETGCVVIDRPATLVMYTVGVTESTRDAIAGERTLYSLLGSRPLNFAANPARFVERTVDRHQFAGRRCHHDGPIRLHARQPGIGMLPTPPPHMQSKGAVLAALHELADFTVEQEQNLQMIFSELVGNAVRHAPGALSISISATGGKVRLHVIDEGPGFDRRPALPNDIWSGVGAWTLSDLLARRRLDGRASSGFRQFHHRRIAVSGVQNEMRTINRRGAVAALAAVAAAPFAGVVSAADKITISVPSTNVDDAAIFVAVQKGYFAASGLDADIIVAGGGVATPGLLSGSLQASASPAAALSSIQRGGELRILRVYRTSPPNQLRGNESIRTLADLKGKTVGVQSRGDTFELSTRIALQQAGVSADSVGFTPFGVGATVGAALTSGQVPAICTAGVEINELLARGLLKNAHLVLNYYGKIHMPFNGLATSQKLITENPQMVRGIVTGIVKAVRYARAFKAQTAAITGKYQKDPNMTALGQDYDTLMQYLTPSLTAPAADLVPDLAVRAALLNIPKAQIPPIDKVYDFSFAQAVDAELDRTRWKPAA